MLASELEKNSDSFSPEPIRSMHSPPAVVSPCSVAPHAKLPCLLSLNQMSCVFY